MTVIGFDRADQKVSIHEGGYVNHPKDPGGETNKGVTRRVYDMFRRSKGLPVRSVKHMTEAERLEIFRTRFWNAVKGDKLPDGVDYPVYDGAVNSGPAQSVKWLQRALGPSYRGKIDGIIGPETLAAVDRHPNHDALIGDMLDHRLAFLKALKTWPTFGKGWTARVNEVRRTAQAWASGDVGPTPTTPNLGQAKAPIEDAKTPPPAEVGTGGAAAGGGIGGVAVAVDRLQDQLTPYSMAGGWIETLVVGLFVLSTVLVVGGVAYRWWAGRKAKALSNALDT